MTNKLVKFQLLLTVFLTPLLRAYKGFGYEQIKISFFLLSISLIGFFWIFRRPKLEWNLIRLASFLFILTLFVSSMMGIDPKNSLIGTDPYFQGWIVYAYLFVFSQIVSTTAIKLKYYAIILTASSVVVSVLAIQDWVLLNFFHQMVPTYAGRVVSTFGQPNFYAGFVLLSLPFTYYLLSKTRSKKVIYLISFILFIELFAIVISQSRTGILLTIFLFYIWLMSKVKAWLNITFITVITIITAILISGYFSSGILSGELLNLKLENNPDLTDESVEKRPYIWAVALEILKKEPAKGYGMENIGSAYINYFIENKHVLFEENLKISPVLISLKDLNIDRTHNYFLDLLLFGGILGALGYIFLIFAIYKKVLLSKIKPESSILLVGLTTYLIWIQFQNQSVVHLIYLWLLVGLSDSDKDLS